MASAQRSPLLQEIGNTTSRKLYSSANNLVDSRSGSSACANLESTDEYITKIDYDSREDNNLSSDSHCGITKVSFNFCDDDEDDCNFFEQTDNSINLTHTYKINQRTHFADEQQISSHSNAYPNVSTITNSEDKCKTLKSHKHSKADSDSSNFVHSVASSLVGTARRVKNKRRDRSKSKEKRRDSSESRLPSLSEFFKSPSGSRKSSLNSPLSPERKNSVAGKFNDPDGSESSPENSIEKSLKHKSRGPKSSLGVFSRIRAWGSRDALDDQPVEKVEYNVLENSINISSFDLQDSERDRYLPRFLTANSREGVDFENLESELCNLDSEHSNDSSRSKNSAHFLVGFERNEPRSSIDSSRSKCSLTSKHSGQYSDRDLDNDSLKLNAKSKSDEFLLNFDENSTSTTSKQPLFLQDFDPQTSNPDYCLNESSTGSFKIMSISRRSSEGTSSASSITSSILATEKFFRKTK